MKYLIIFCFLFLGCSVRFQNVAVGYQVGDCFINRDGKTYKVIKIGNYGLEAREWDANRLDFSDDVVYITNSGLGDSVITDCPDKMLK